MTHADCPGRSGQARSGRDLTSVRANGLHNPFGANQPACWIAQSIVWASVYWPGIDRPNKLEGSGLHNPERQRPRRRGCIRHKWIAQSICVALSLKISSDGVAHLKAGVTRTAHPVGLGIQPVLRTGFAWMGALRLVREVQSVGVTWSQPARGKTALTWQAAWQ